MSTLRPSDTYRGVFHSAASHDIMVRGRILAPGDSADLLLGRLAGRLIKAEAGLGEPRDDAEKVVETFCQYVDAGICILGSPLLTNVSAGHSALASCSAVPLTTLDLSDAALETAESYYRLNMGSGFNLDAFADPVDALLRLNGHAKSLESAAVCERYIGNMAHVSVGHSKVQAFMAAKAIHRGLRHFNISVDVNDQFMKAKDEGADFTLRDGTIVAAADLWKDLVDSAWACGDPGLISLDRFNAHNPVAALSPYVTTAPCAEVGLAPGETCLFGYVNLAACLKWDGSRLALDTDLVGNVADCLTRVLDDCLEDSLAGFPTYASASVMSSNRKIGIGICGFADALVWAGLDYGSLESTALLRAALSAVNFRSKHASMLLARRRGRFGSFEHSRYARDNGYLLRFVPHADEAYAELWRELDAQVAIYGLRNAMTTALPPSGRSSLLLGVSASIEPLLREPGKSDLSSAERALQSAGLVRRSANGVMHVVEPAVGAAWPQKAMSSASVFRGARELSVAEHLTVLEAACKLVDDGVSKTVNLPASASRTDVDGIYTRAWQAGLKAISVYRDGSIADDQGGDTAPIPTRVFNPTVESTR